MLKDYAGPKDFHCHTNYCDGSSCPEEMIISAIDKGMQTLGFSGHCYTFFDESYCMLPDDVRAYEKDVREMAVKYADKIKVLCGIEQDYWSEEPYDNWDYLIGSVHYIRIDNPGISAPEGCFPIGQYVYIPVDETAEITDAAVSAYFGGDYYAFAEKYFETAADVVNKLHPDIIGHLDLVCKFNRNGDGVRAGSQFDESHPRFVAAWTKAVDELVKNDVPFEINTSSLLKGYRNEAYPSKPIRDYIAEKGGSFIMSSDSHKPETLCYGFDKY